MIGAKIIDSDFADYRDEKSEGEIFECLAGYAWREAFGYAGGPNSNGAGPSVMRVEGATVEATPFRRSDVVEIVGVVEGDNDGPHWRVAGRLADGRWFYLNAWCDYTGWDCQAGGQAWVADDRDSLIQFGIPAEDRDLWGLS